MSAISDSGERAAWDWAQGLVREPAKQRRFLPAVASLAALSVPFYWSWFGTPVVWFGLPAWVWVTTACSAGISCVTAWAATRHWHDERDDDLEASP